MALVCPAGVLNTIRADGKRIIAPDPVLGPIVTKIFEWFASGEYSLRTLAQKAYGEGFRFRKSRNKIPLTTLQKILRKRIYTGDFNYGGAIYQGSHEPLVTREVWNRVQEILDGRHANKHRKVTHDFVYSGRVKCGHCGCSMVGEVKKGRYVYYHCTGYRGKCPEPYTREEILERQIADVLRDLVVPPAVLAWMQSELVVSDQTEEAARAQTARRQQMELERLQARMDVLYDDRLDGRIDAATYDKKAGEIREQQEQIRQKIRTIEAMTLPSASEAVDLMMLTSKAADLYVAQTGAEQRKLLHLVLKEASWKGGELRMLLREPFQELRLSNSGSDRNCKEFGPSGPDFDNWRRKRDSNPRRVTPLTVFETAAIQPLGHSSVIPIIPGPFTPGHGTVRGHPAWPAARRACSSPPGAVPCPRAASCAGCKTFRLAPGRSGPLRSGR